MLEADAEEVDDGIRVVLEESEDEEEEEEAECDEAECAEAEAKEADAREAVREEERVGAEFAALERLLLLMFVLSSETGGKSSEEMKT
jgi:hypothetical protein